MIDLVTKYSIELNWIEFYAIIHWKMLDRDDIYFYLTKLTIHECSVVD